MKAGIEPLRPRAAACRDDLPRMTPEMLWFQSFLKEAPERAVLLGDVDVVFHFNGTVYAMAQEDWLHFEEMQRAGMIGPLSHLMPPVAG